MDIKYIQQFKDREEVQTLDEDILNNILELFSSSNIKIKRYNNTEKKNSFNDNIKNSIKRVDNKTNLIINKISNTNINVITKEFITTFNYLTQKDFDIVQKCFFIELIKNDTFQKSIYELYNNISIIYINHCNLNEHSFINLVENKIINDYIENLNDDFFESLNNEDSRINFLNLLNLMNTNKLNNNFIDNFTTILLNTDEIPDILCWFKINNITDYSLLENKKEKDLSNRFRILLDNVLENNMDDEEYSIDDDEDEEDNKTELETEIDNIIEEYLFLNDFNEIKIYCKKLGENNELLFMTELLNYYFISKSDEHFNDYRNLFTLLYSKRTIKRINFIDAYNNVLQNNLSLYKNINQKKNNIKQIYNLLKIKI